jgi:replicative DNA helicase
MSAAIARRGAIGGITTGLKTLDNQTDGLRRGEFVLWAGRPGMGKSGLMESSARMTAAARYNCLIFSLEMGSVSLGSRAISDLLYESDDPVPYWKIVRGELADNQARTVVDAARDLRDLPLVIDPQHRRRSRKSRHGLVNMLARWNARARRWMWSTWTTSTSSGQTIAIAEIARRRSPKFSPR